MISVTITGKVGRANGKFDDCTKSFWRIKQAEDNSEAKEVSLAE